MGKETYITHSQRETQKKALEFAKKLKPGDIVGLTGELGSGKTTFIQGIGKTFGIEKMASPTFVYLKSYPLKERPLKVRVLQHFDLYRVEKDEDFSPELWDYLGQEKSVSLIEWVEKIKSLEEKLKYLIRLENLGEDKRKITIIEK